MSPDTQLQDLRGAEREDKAQVESSTLRTMGWMPHSSSPWAALQETSRLSLTLGLRAFLPEPP